MESSPRVDVTKNAACPTKGDAEILILEFLPQDELQLCHFPGSGTLGSYVASQRLSLIKCHIQQHDTPNSDFDY